MKSPGNVEKSSPYCTLSCEEKNEDRSRREKKNEEELTGIAHRKRSKKMIKQTISNPPMMYHLHFRQIIFLNVLKGDENQRNDVSGRLQ